MKNGKKDTFFFRYIFEVITIRIWTITRSHGIFGQFKFLTSKYEKTIARLKTQFRQNWLLPRNIGKCYFPISDFNLARVSMASRMTISPSQPYFVSFNNHLVIKFSKYLSIFRQSFNESINASFAWFRVKTGASRGMVIEIVSEDT